MKGFRVMISSSRSVCGLRFEEAIRLAANKLPLGSKFVMRPGAEKVTAAVS